MIYLLNSLQVVSKIDFVKGKYKWGNKCKENIVVQRHPLAKSVDIPDYLLQGKDIVFY